ncbi:rhomboid family intramembrane serine protease [Thermodesulfobacteriota bacterium]
MPGFSSNPFLILAPEHRSLLFLGATGTGPIDYYHRYWTIVSANYLHGGFLHILFNMVALRQLGDLVFREYGSHRTVIIYVLGGAVGFWISYRAGVTFTFGASAAVCTLIGTLIYYGISRGGTYGRAIYTQIGGWALGIFLFGLIVPKINNWAHAGGFFIGLALGYFLGYQERSRENLFHKILSGICIAVTGVVLTWAVINGVYLRVAAGG